MGSRGHPPPQRARRISVLLCCSSHAHCTNCALTKASGDSWNCSLIVNFTLPDSNHQPALGSQGQCGSDVALPVPAKLFGPKCFVTPWWRVAVGEPCQKQPSTKSTTRCAGQAKSGVPGSCKCRRQPLRPALRKLSPWRVLCFVRFPRMALIVRERVGVGFLNFGSDVTSQTDCRGSSRSPGLSLLVRISYTLGSIRIGTDTMGSKPKKRLEVGAAGRQGRQQHLPSCSASSRAQWDWILDLSPGAGDHTRLRSGS